ncbi:HD domain-containing phosphohydrolase [Bdellovibrio bacteriovorus]|uniref:HD-GYP domain-containing protein n=1 Tax=Bdellovibrio bacteriovorus str. Tiberius TaxID=1069642 RepID=K7YUW3_BDEBC|nr:HD domain-containing phosphohydrolase [Bdellovibrio bacteriovorus]AFY01428.1 hypothetical protein Bdt_1738 [Bdellovibrio bacteriovorus str. Tiberius]
MTDTRTLTLFRQKLELLILSEDEAILNRAKEVISRHYLTFKQMRYSELDAASRSELMRAQMVLMVQEQNEDLSAFAARVDQVLNLFPRSRIVTVMAASLSRENLEGTQNPRVTPLSQSEFNRTLKFEYICLYRCRAQYFEIQIGDLFPMTTMTFPVFVRMPLNQRYLAVVYSNSVLSDERFQRVGKADNTFIQNRDSEKYLDYITNYYDTSGHGLKKRARALFLSLCHGALYLNEILLFDFKSPGPGTFRSRYEALLKTASDLLQLLGTEEDLWDLFREVLEGEFYEIWRAPWIAVYGAIISRKSGQGDPLTVLIAGLLTDVGLFDIDDRISREFLTSEGRTVLEEQQREFNNHPILSMNRCLIKGLPLTEEVKAVMVCTHERFDEKGFPNQVPADKIPVEALILQFAEKIDQGVLTTMKKNGVGFRFLKEKIWEAENNSGVAFPPAFLAAIADSLL